MALHADGPWGRDTSEMSGREKTPGYRAAFTLVELLVVLAIIAVLLGILLPAIQRIRGVAVRAHCANNAHQLGVALHQYHDSCKVFPPGLTTTHSGDPFPWMTWLTRITPYMEQQALWNAAVQAYRQDVWPFDNPPHTDFATVVPSFVCPGDERVSHTQDTHNDYRVGLTSYVGVNGTDFTAKDGVLFTDSHVRLTDIGDGTSSTLMVGERPPSSDFWYGWWYAAQSQQASGSPDVVLGVREIQQNALFLYTCPPGPYHFQGGSVDNQCDVLHFWGPHFGGSHFLFADGSVHFLGYSADSVLPALATRNGGEHVQVP